MLLIRILFRTYEYDEMFMLWGFPVIVKTRKVPFEIMEFSDWSSV